MIVVMSTNTIVKYNAGHQMLVAGNKAIKNDPMKPRLELSLDIQEIERSATMVRRKRLLRQHGLKHRS